MPFRPAGSDHAIVSNVFTLALDTAFSEGAISKLKSRPAPWSELLPGTRDVGGFDVVLLDGLPQPRRRVGVEYSFYKPDGAATWLLRIGGQEVTVECNLYSRWDHVWSQAKLLLSQAMTFSRADGASSFSSFSMTVFDQFITDTADENTSRLFQPSPLMGTRLFDTTALWHQHIGWLDVEPEGELLTNVNIDVLPMDVNDRSRGKIVNLSHLQRISASLPLGEANDANAAKLDGMASRMHTRNKDTLALMLSEEMQKSIKLSGDKK